MRAMFSSICAWPNGWANTRDTGDLRRNRAHYDVIVRNYDCLFDSEATMKGVGEKSSVTNHSAQ